MRQSSVSVVLPRMTGWPSAWITYPMPRPIATKKNAKSRAERSAMKWLTNAHTAAISAKAAATLARWNTTIRGRWKSAARWPRASQNMNR